MNKKVLNLLKRRKKYNQKLQLMQWRSLNHALLIVDRITKIEMKLLKMGYSKLVEIGVVKYESK